MNNYLTKDQLRTSLNVGKAIEQWLGFYEGSGERILKWLRIYPENKNYNVMYVECYDQGSVDFIDIYDFTIVDPDEPYGVIKSFPSINEAIVFSKNEYNASEDHFVNDGMIQQEYLTYLNEKT